MAVFTKKNVIFSFSHIKCLITITYYDVNGPLKHPTVETFARNSHTLFHTKINGVANGLSLVNTFCTQSEKSLPTQIDNNDIYRTIPLRGWIQEDPKYWRTSPYQLTIALNSRKKQWLF